MAWNTLYTYSGKVSFEEGGAPSLLDIAVSLGRECRYAGAGMRWWPVILHAFVVADLLPGPLKFYGLNHDDSECITGDIPNPVKSEPAIAAAIKSFEQKMQHAIYDSFKVPPPSPSQEHIVKTADRLALHGEVYTVGTQALQEFFPRSPAAENLILKYLSEFPPDECIRPDGRAPIEFMNRFRVYRDMMMEVEE